MLLAAASTAASRGRATVDLDEWLPASSAEPAYKYVRLLERIEAYAGRGHLLVGKPGDGTVKLRRWFADQVAVQITGAPNRWG